DPPGARVEVAGAEPITSPGSIDGLEPGACDVSISLDGYEPVLQSVNVEPGRFVSPPVIKLVRGEGAVRVESTPPGSSWEIVGTPCEIGMTVRKGRTPATIAKLPSGAYEIAFNQPGWAPVRKKIDVGVGTTVSLSHTFATGALAVSGNIPGATWTVVQYPGGDDSPKLSGSVPDALPQVPEGDYVIEFNAQGFPPAREKVSVFSGRAARVSHDFVAAPNVQQQGTNTQTSGSSTSTTSSSSATSVQRTTPAPVTAQGGPASGSGWRVPDCGIELLWVQPGSFTMGSPAGEPDRLAAEAQHRVTLTQGYWLGKYEVTQGQWTAIMGSNPSSFSDAGSSTPVDSISWDDAMAFCRKLTERERAAGRLPAGYEYSLPTEAEWEYACRAGTTTAFSFGDDGSNLFRCGNYCDKTNTCDFSWQDKDHSDGFDKAAPVGRFKANPWGFCDMHGNVWEWCWDFLGDYPASSVTDPVGPASGSVRVLRGGGWDDDAKSARSAFRFTFGNQDKHYYANGMRLALHPARNAAAPRQPARVDPPAAPQPQNPSAQPPQTAAAPREGANFRISSPVIEMLWVQPGSFTMGSPESEGDRDSSETPHRVTLSRGYWLGKYEVTQGQWTAIMGSNPSNFIESGNSAPVENISWNEALAFCRKLTERERAAGRLPAGYEYSLPTEAEWEYACRAGTATAFSFGDDGSNLFRYGNYCDLANKNDFPWRDKDHSDGFDKTAPVGRFKANPWGFCDMHGNVWEWTLDWMGDYPASGATDPKGVSDGTERVLRGGGWDDKPAAARSAYRYTFGDPDKKYYANGMRLALRPAR
ncbi:MAG TPA: SUMF1/EgtB/PvdO family nonheme iron enzyme, partial [Opitutales bacterium]|nr:SUMF1/EgtB/PvdO family nonheme iron enzyme [Opitutales bacterium]